MADFLATHALRLPVGVHFFNSVPLGLSPILYSDMYGVAQPHFVPSSSSLLEPSFYQKKKKKSLPELKRNLDLIELVESRERNYPL